jgi:TetR/AcrR family transcriptional regulator, cholesterol catabolism regulator
MTGASTDRGSGREPTKGDRTRRRLLDAAAAELARNGRAGAGLGAIARAAGLRTGSIYFHFASKDELIEAVLEEGLRATLGYLDEALAAAGPGASPAARLRAAIRAHSESAYRLRDYTVVVLTPEHSAPPAEPRPSVPSADLGPSMTAAGAGPAGTADEPRPSAGEPAPVFRELRHAYADRWTRLLTEAQRAGARPASVDARLTRDLLFGALNAVSLAGRPPDEVSAAIQTLLGLADPG